MNPFQQLSECLAKVLLGSRRVYQAKSAQLAPKEVREVFERFLRFETRHPQVARVHTLVTPRLPPTLAWVGRDVARVRKPRPFYAPFPRLVAASDEKLRRDLVDQFGDELGRFVADSVEVAEQVLPGRDVGESAFSIALARAFPPLDAGPRKLAAATGAEIERSYWLPFDPSLQQPGRSGELPSVSRKHVDSGNFAIHSIRA